MNTHRGVRRIAGIGVGGLVLVAASAGIAAADVGIRDSFPKDGLHCGGQERITGDSGIGPLTFKQHSWIYYNCGDSSVHRKSDVSNGFDGPCIGVGPGQALVIDAFWKGPIGPPSYNGSKAC